MHWSEKLLTRHIKCIICRTEKYGKDYRLVIIYNFSYSVCSHVDTTPELIPNKFTKAAKRKVRV